MALVKMARSKPEQRIVYDQYRGVDFTNQPGDVDETRSPDALNMISDMGKRPVKRLGYEMVLRTENEAEVFGIYSLVRYENEQEITTILAHIGSQLCIIYPDAPLAKTFSFDNIDFSDFTFSFDKYDPKKRSAYKPIYNGMAQQKSMAFQMDSKLWIVDGKTFLVWDGTDTVNSVVPVSSIAYVPELVIAAPPSGGGEVFEQRNMLTPKSINSFYVWDDTATETTFQLNIRGYDSIISVERLNLNGQWDNITSTVIPATADDKRDGLVRFSVPPGKSVIQGDDNVKITFSSENSDQLGKINKCTFGIEWGIGGSNRLVLAGNPSTPNTDYLSDISRPGFPAPTYFPENMYNVVGQDMSPITGYVKFEDKLAIIKKQNDQDSSIFIRSGQLTDDLEPFFTIKESGSGIGGLSPHAMCMLRDDPLFLSDVGVFSLTINAITGSRMANPRSELVNKRLKRESGIENAVMIEYDEYMYLAINDHVYVCDASQRSDIFGAQSYQFQYEWYYWDNIPATVWFKYDGKLWFGTKKGEIFRFYTEHKTTSYNDNGKPIRAYWTSPEMPLSTYTRYKSLKRVYSKVTPFSRSSVDVYIKEEGGLELYDERDVDIFSFDDMNFERFTFNTDTDVGVIATRAKIKRVITTQVRLENKKLNEPFGITSVTLYFDEKGKVK